MQSCALFWDTWHNLFSAVKLSIKSSFVINGGYRFANRCISDVAMYSNKLTGP